MGCPREGLGQSDECGGVRLRGQFDDAVGDGKPGLVVDVVEIHHAEFLSSLGVILPGRRRSPYGAPERLCRSKGKVPERAVLRDPSLAKLASFDIRGPAP